MKVLIVKNISREGPGLLQEVLIENEISYDVVDLDQKEKIPEIIWSQVGIGKFGIQTYPPAAHSFRTSSGILCKRFQVSAV